MAQTDGHVPELTPDPRKCFLRKVDQSQSAPSRRLQPASLPCSRLRVVPGKTAESYSLFNILLGSGIIFTPWQIVAHRLALFLCVCVCPSYLPSNCFSVIVWISDEITFDSLRAKWNVAKRHTIRCEFLQIGSTTKSFHRGCGSCWSEPCWMLGVHTFILPWALFTNLCVSFYGLRAANAEDSLHYRKARIRLSRHTMVTYIVCVLYVRDGVCGAPCMHMLVCF